MSYLLEMLGRGWLGRLSDAFQDRLTRIPARDCETLRPLIEQNPGEHYLRIELGFSYLGKRKVVQAREAFSAALKLNPSSILALVSRACCQEEMGLFEDAATDLKAACNLLPDDVAIQFGLGYCRERAGRTDEAIEHYQSALRLCPSLRNAH